MEPPLKRHNRRGPTRTHTTILEMIQETMVAGGRPRVFRFWGLWSVS